MIDNFDLFKLDVIEYLDKIEAKCKRWGVPMSKITLVMRNPDKPEMFIVLSTETPEGLKIVAELATRKQEDQINGQ